jgi:hypothetical protein
MMVFNRIRHIRAASASRTGRFLSTITAGQIRFRG